MSEGLCWSLGEGAAGSLSLFQKIEGELSFFLELLGGSNKRARVVDPDHLRNLASEFKGAAAYGATQIQSPLGLIRGL